MNSKPEVFAVVWVDLMLGIPLSLICASGKEALDKASSIRANGVGKVDHVKAVYAAEGSDELEIILAA